jgi:hypothetical protein
MSPGILHYTQSRSTQHSIAYKHASNRKYTAIDTAIDTVLDTWLDLRFKQIQLANVRPTNIQSASNSPKKPNPVYFIY